MAKGDIELNTRPDRRLILMLLRRGIWANRSTRSLMVASVMGPVVLPFLFRMLSPTHQFPPAPALGFLLVGPFFIFVLFVLAPRRALKNRGVKEMLEHGVQLRFTESGMRAQSRSGARELPWEKIGAVDAVSGAYLVAVKDTTERFVVPRKDFASAKDQEAFRVLVTRKLGMRAHLGEG